MRVKRLVGQAVASANYASRPGSVGGPARARSFAPHRYTRPQSRVDFAAALRGN